MTTEQSNEVRRLTLAAQQSGGIVAVRTSPFPNGPAVVNIAWEHGFGGETIHSQVVVVADGSRL